MKAPSVAIAVNGGWRVVLLLVPVLVVLLEQVLAEVAGEVAPDGVDVVAIVLGVIEFDEE